PDACRVPLDKAAIDAHARAYRMARPRPAEQIPAHRNGPSGNARADRIEIEHALPRREMQLGSLGIGIGVMDMIDGIHKVIIEIAEEVAPERHAEMTEVEADAGS